MQKDPTNNPQAVQAIYHAGGHFVLCLEDKRPLWRSWQKLRPGLDVVLAHEGPLGLKPWSISTTALDVDRGDPGALIRAWPPMAVLNSRRTDGKHLYYSDTQGRGNGHFEVYDCSGEVRGASGYLILWHDGARRLAEALQDPLARARRWPRDLFELAGLPPVTLPHPVKTPAYNYKPSAQSRQAWATAADAVHLEHVQRGQRNLKLFDAVRFWAYSVPSEDPPHGGQESANQPQQALAGLASGEARRSGNRARDTAWRAAYAAGQSLRSIAKEYGVEPSTVYRVLRERNRVLREQNRVRNEQNCMPGTPSNQSPLEAWNRRVRVHALEQNQRFPEPLDEREVVHTAYSISTWCWSGGGSKWHYPKYFRHDSQNQSKRGIKSGKVRRARNAGRDAAIVAAVRAGQSMRAVAKEWGLSDYAVRHVCSRVRYEPNQCLWGCRG